MEESWRLELEKQFIEMYEGNEFNWDEIEDSWYLLNEVSVDENQSGGDGYIDVVNVFKAQDRFFKVEYQLMGKDLDEEYNMTNPVEVYPHRVMTIEYKEEKPKSIGDE